MEIGTRTEEHYLHILLIEQKPGFFSRLKHSLSRRPNGEYTKKELAVKLAEKADTSKRTAYDFLGKLTDHDVLVETGKRPGPSKPEQLYRIDRSQLLTELKETDWYQQRVDLWRYLLDSLGDF